AVLRLPERSPKCYVCYVLHHGWLYPSAMLLLPNERTRGNWDSIIIHLLMRTSGAVAAAEWIVSVVFYKLIFEGLYGSHWDIVFEEEEEEEEEKKALSVVIVVKMLINLLKPDFWKEYTSKAIHRNSFLCKPFFCRPHFTRFDIVAIFILGTRENWILDELDALT
ncbi:hypothetical protein ACJX0J_025677, partial [Zea mays]